MRRHPRTIRGRARPVPAFTLVETIVAVGALAFVAVGIAVIFDATGKTITTGKRVSAFNTYATMIEQRLRDDINNMTRDGYLLIRSELANADNSGGVLPNPTGPATNAYPGNPDAIPLYEDEPRSRWRPRRTDELMFFAKGRFTSAREPLVAGVIPSSDAARIYYGHGRARLRDVSPGSRYLQPPHDDVNDDQNSLLGYNHADNYNRFASNWTLLRHVTLLCPPRTTTRPDPLTPPNGPRPTWVTYPAYFVDSETQHALHPAASSVFRSLAGILGSTRPPASRIPGYADYPTFASGLVDVASTDLSVIRSVVTTSIVAPGSVNSSFLLPSSGNLGEFDPAAIETLARVQSWMIDGLPTDSPGLHGDPVRIRYEPAPPNFAGVLRDPMPPADRAVRRADQLMLASSNFLPRCTEFIVEWSFGNTYPAGHTDADGHLNEFEIIWHGMEREVRSPSNGRVTLALPYDHTDADVSVLRRIERANGAIVPPLPHPDVGNGVRVPTELIHGVGASFSAGDPVTSFFGYVDPTFIPDLNGNFFYGDPTDAASATIPWPWPRMIRITLSLADPSDPAVERSFQFVFDVPQDGAR